jgi:hypothetical protein
MAPWLLVGGVVLAAVAIYTALGLRSHTYQPDEALYVGLAQYVGHTGLSSLFEWTVYQRGIQRLTVWLLTPEFALFDAPRAFVVGHVVQSLAFATAAIPAYRLGRGLGLRPAWAVVPAIMTVAIPWGIMATTFLTEPVGYAAFIWLIYLTWRAVVEPRPRNDALALAATAIALLSRTNYMTLLPLAPLAALAFSWPRAGSWRERVRGWPAAAWHRHAVIVVATIAALVLLAAWTATGGGLTKLAGTYVLPSFSDLGGVLSKEVRWLSRVVAGTAYLPAIFALPWLLQGLMRPRQPERQAFAVVVVLAVVALLVSLAGATPDERYIMTLAPVLAVAACAGIARREVPLVGVAVALAACVALVGAEHWGANGGSYAYFAFPAEAFHHELVLGRLSVPPLSALPGGPGFEFAILYVVAGVACLALLRARRTAAVAPAVIVGVLGVAQVFVGGYALKKFDKFVGHPTPLSLHDRAFIDRRIPRGEVAGIWGIGPGDLPDLVGLYREAEFWNTQLRDVVRVGDSTFAPYPPTLPRDTKLDLVTATGAVNVEGSPVPRILLVPQRLNTLSLVSRRLAPGYLPLDVVSPRRPLQARWQINRVEADGRVDAGTRAHMWMFAAGAPKGGCGLLGLQAPAGGGAR